MEQIICRKGMAVHPDKAQVFSLLQCTPDSPVYEEMEEEYEALAGPAAEMAQPVILMCFSGMEKEIASLKYPEGTPVLYVITSVGRKLTESSTGFFREGDYVKGLLMDAIADTCLFSLEEHVKGILREECQKRGFGISACLEAPSDISMDAQEVACRLTKAGEKAGICVTSGKMLDPVKSNCHLYILTSDQAMWKTDHDCRRCERKDCMFRNVQPVRLTVLQEGKPPAEAEGQDGESLLESMLRAGVFIQSPCGGTGRCGKCKVRVLKGDVKAEGEQAFLSEEEMRAGIHLACKTFPLEECVISLDAKEGYEAVAEYAVTGEDKANPAPFAAGDAEESSRGLGIAIDIGTTTIALQLLAAGKGEPLFSCTVQNHQSAYGADVISRIQAANAGKGDELRRAVVKDLQEGIRMLLAGGKRQKEHIREMVIAGNTTMVHLLMGYSCETLGTAPFTAVTLDGIGMDAGEILEDEGFRGCAAKIFPGISVYVGGDIVSGLLCCGFEKRVRPSLFIDLGTNGEVAIGNQERILAASTAAGPAFEGGNISCGMGSVPGAICHVRLKDKRIDELKTIGDESPCGLCGTGVIEMTAELLREGLLDETGLLDEDFFEKGFCVSEGPRGAVTFTQKDVREVQLAKAAIRAGVETLMEAYGAGPEDLEHVYVAGGFGYRMDLKKAVFIGLLPEALKDKVKAVGNSSLGGAARCLREKDGLKTAENIRRVSAEVSLAASRKFQQAYVESMMLQES